jgi:hypothetical protein
MMEQMSAVPGLAEPFVVDAETIARFGAEGHCVDRALASPDEISHYRPAIDGATDAGRSDRRPLAQRDTYGRAFIQSMNIHLLDPVVHTFVHSPRFAGVAAALLGVDGVRLYHDQALYKEPGGGHTPWHQDQVYWPLDTDQTITMWMPLVDVGPTDGAMVFADGSWRCGDLGGKIIGDESEAHFAEVVRRHGFDCTDHAPLRAGDATFHRGWTLHCAPPNTSAAMRSVMTIIYFADGARITEPDSDAQRADLGRWLDGGAPGALADGPSNPLLWPAP